MTSLLTRKKKNKNMIDIIQESNYTIQLILYFRYHFRL